jgi:hypothetical protein
VLKQSIKFVPLSIFMAHAQKTRVDVIFDGFTRWMHKVLNVNDYSVRAMSVAIMSGECGSLAASAEQPPYRQRRLSILNNPFDVATSARLRQRWPSLE